MGDEFLTFGPPGADIATSMHRQPALDPAVSLADDAARTSETPEAVGRTLRAAAERGFTGELLLSMGTGVRVFLDDGNPYFAERVGDAPLGQRLVSLGVLTDEQRLRGRVLVGDVEHLGRLFDRDPSIDRDGAIAAVEVMTDELLTEVAGGHAAVEVMPYRHHASGVHRWFVGPVGAASRRPVDAVAQLDRSVFDQLPDINAGEPAPLPAPSPEPTMHIEWDLDQRDAEGVHDQVDESFDERVDGAVDRSDDEVEYDLDAEWERFDAARHDAVHAESAAEPGGAAATSPFDAPPRPTGSPLPSTPDEVEAPSTGDASATRGETAGALDDRFTIVWPDGSVDAPIPPPSVEETTDRREADDTTATDTPDPAGSDPTDSTDSTVPETTEASVAAGGERTTEPSDAVPVVGVPSAPVDALESAPPALAPPSLDGFRLPSAAPEPSGAPPPPPTEPSAIRVPSLAFDRLPEPDAEVPDDVADAVRRALAAIERAAAEPDAPTRLSVGSVELPDFSVPKLLDAPAPSTDPGAAAAGPTAAAVDEIVEPEPDSSPATPIARNEPPASVAAPPTAAPEASPASADEQPTALAAPSAASIDAFAPPTADMRAEAVYARAAAPNPPGSTGDGDDTEARRPGQASVVFVDDDDEGDERKGALKRLIGSLRRSK